MSHYRLSRGIEEFSRIARPITASVQQPDICFISSLPIELRLEDIYLRHHVLADEVVHGQRCCGNSRKKSK